LPAIEDDAEVVLLSLPQAVSAAIATAEAEETNTLPKPLRSTRAYFPLNAFSANLLGGG
jgi:hypothetical protein